MTNAHPRPDLSWLGLSQVTLIAVTDACAIASSACHVARSGTASVLASLAGTGRSNVYIGEDVEAELPEALQKVATDMGVPLHDANRALRQIMTHIRVVPLRMGDYLNPAVAGVRRCDPELPCAARGDPDDLGTAALAAFLAPAVIISKDSVFSRFGLALPADRWTEEAARLLVAAGYDAALDDAAHAAEVGARLLFGVIGAAKNAAMRNPRAAITTAAIVGLAGWYCHRRGWITGDQLRAAGRRMASAARPLAERAVAADARRNEARAALTVVDWRGVASLEERCARQLARRVAPGPRRNCQPCSPSAAKQLLLTPSVPYWTRIRHSPRTHRADSSLADRQACLRSVPGTAADLYLWPARDARPCPAAGAWDCLIVSPGTSAHVSEAAWECLRRTSAGRPTSTTSPTPRNTRWPWTS